MVALLNGLMVFPGTKFAITTVITAVVVSGVIYWLFQRKKSDKIPYKWRTVGKVQNLYIYPLKSGKAIEVNQADCTLLGLREATNVSSDGHGDTPVEKFLLQDRFFMIYQVPSLKFLTARQKPITLLITVRSAGPNSVTLSIPNSDGAITFQVVKDTSNRVRISMHSNEEIDIVDCGDEVAGWLSNVIFSKESGLRLGYYPEAEVRLRTMQTGLYCDKPVLFKYMNDADFGAYSDVASYMLLSQNSMDDLKKRLEPEAGDVTLRHFRPNIVVSGPEISAYDEDNWGWIKIGEKVVLKGFKPCTRCTMVTLDPDKGVAHPAKEPFVTLKKYRQVTDPVLKTVEGNAPVFGRYFGLHNVGSVAVGDSVYVPA